MNDLPELADRIRDYEAYCMGSESLHRHPIVRGFLYTDGIALLERNGCGWFVDAVASHQPGIVRRFGNRAEFQVWRVRSAGGEGLQVDAWTDTPERPGSQKLAAQTWTSGDFPRGLIDDGKGEWTFYVEHGTAMLKRER